MTYRAGRTQWQLHHPVKVMSKEAGNLQITAQLSGSSREVGSVFDATHYLSRQLVFSCLVQAAWLVSASWLAPSVQFRLFSVSAVLIDYIWMRHEGIIESCQFLGHPKAIKLTISEFHDIFCIIEYFSYVKASSSFTSVLIFCILRSFLQDGGVQAQWKLIHNIHSCMWTLKLAIWPRSICLSCSLLP